jgi:outer membrane protein assembly factor BamB/serine/threonine protein kinase
VTDIDDETPQPSQRVVGRYELIDELGRGGMAVVHLARQTDLGRQVALKELSSFHAGAPEFIARFVRESQLAGSLSHPSIVIVFEYFVSEGIPFIAMEYLPQGSLRRHVGRLSTVQIVGVLESVLAGLSHAESFGIVHRDLKPENILVTADGRAKIADFGIAKATQSAGGGEYLTATGSTIGTPSYMAPEQAMAQEVGPWTDLYSVGVMAYEHLAGRVPFHDLHAPMAILMAQVNQRIPPLTEVNPGVDPALSAWVDGLLAKDVSQRTRDAATAWDSLEEIVIKLVGPRWRREARLPSELQPERTPLPLTPVPFTSVRAKTPPAVPAPESGYVTFDRPPATPDPTHAPTRTPPTLEPSAPDAPDPPGSTTPDTATPPSRTLPTTPETRPSVHAFGEDASKGAVSGYYTYEERQAAKERPVDAPPAAQEPAQTPTAPETSESRQTPAEPPPAPPRAPAPAPAPAAPPSRGRRRGLVAAGIAAALAAAAALVVVLASGGGGGGGSGTTAATQASALRWSYDAGGFVSSHPAVAEGRVIFGSQDQDVFAVDASTGRQRWDFQTGRLVFSSAAVSGGIAYIGSNDGGLYAIGVASGKRVWKFTTGNSVRSSPAVADGLVYVGSDDAKVYAVDAKSGRERWEFETGQPVISSPAVSDGSVFIGSMDHQVYSLNAKTGAKQWRFRTGDQVWSSPAVVHGTVYIGSNDHRLYALDERTGRPRWSFRTDGVVSSSPRVALGTVYVGSFDKHVYAVDAATGKERWRFATGNFVFSSPAISHGTVYVGSHDHNLYAIDAASGHRRWSYKTGGIVGSSPTVAGDTVYVGSDDGHVYALKAGGPS